MWSKEGEKKSKMRQKEEKMTGRQKIKEKEEVTFITEPIKTLSM